MTDDQALEVAKAATAVARHSQKRSLLVSPMAWRKSLKEKLATAFLKLPRHPVPHQLSLQLNLRRTKKTVTLKSQRKKWVKPRPRSKRC